MKRFCLILLSLFITLNAFSNEIDLTEVNLLEEEKSLSLNTCKKDYDEYLKFKRNKMLYGPLAGVVMVGAGAGGVGFGAFYIATQVTDQALTQIAILNSGLALGTLVGVAGYSAYETAAIINFIKTKQLVNGINEATAGGSGDKALLKLMKNYLKQYPDDYSKISIQKISSFIKSHIEDKTLCDGSMKKRPSNADAKLKKRIATQRDIFRKIHSELI